MNDAQPAAGSAILCRGLKRPFGAGGRAILYGGFEVPRGGIVALVGLSGVGKTTLLNMLSGVDKASFEGEDPALRLTLRDGTSADVGAGAPYPRERVGIIFQRGYLLSNASVGLNLAVPATLGGREARDTDLEDRLESVGLARSYRVQRPWQISGGEAQRVGIARALIRDPDIVFADEPTSNLDEDAANKVMGQIQGWARAESHRTVVWVSHDLELVAKFADHVLVMGKAPQEGDPEGLRRVSLTLHGRPGSAQELHGWKYAASKAAKEGSSEQPAEPAPLPQARPRRGRIAWRLALSELFSRRSSLRTARDTGFAETLHRTTSAWAPGRPSLAGLRVMRAFAPFNVFLITMMAVLLASAMASALVLNYRSFQASLKDPRNCHVVVQGGVDEEGRPLRMSEVTLQEMGARPWRSDVPPGALIEERRPGEEFIRAGCATGPAAFGRLDFGRGILNLPEEGGQCPARGGVPISMMVGSPNEPILEHAVLTRVYARHAAAGQSILDLSRTPVAAPGEERPPRFLFRNREIFLSEYAMAELEKIGEIPDRRPQICLTYLGATKKFTIAGVVGAFEAPRTTRYELFILDTTVKRMIGDTATAQNFSEMQVYFDPAHLSDARSWLEREGWRFIGDMMDRTENLIAAAWNGLMILGAIALANLVLFIAITYYIATSYLAKNAQSFAVLQSFGLSWRTAAWQSAIETTLTLVLAALPLAMVPVALAIAGPLELGEFGTLGWQEAAAILGGVVGVFAVFAWTTAALATRYWWRRHEYRSELIA